MGQPKPSHHHIDRHAAEVAAQGAGNPDDLLTTKQLADWTRLSTQFFEIGRHKGYGPAYIRLSTRRIRYRRSDVWAWLEARKHACTREYA